jgi:hypothetical protein
MITRLSSVIRPKGSDLIFDHPYNADLARVCGLPFARWRLYRLAGYVCPSRHERDLQHRRGLSSAVSAPKMTRPRGEGGRGMADDPPGQSAPDPGLAGFLDAPRQQLRLAEGGAEHCPLDRQQRQAVDSSAGRGVSPAIRMTPTAIANGMAFEGRNEQLAARGRGLAWTAWHCDRVRPSV